MYKFLCGHMCSFLLSKRMYFLIIKVIHVTSEEFFIYGNIKLGQWLLPNYIFQRW